MKACYSFSGLCRTGQKATSSRFAGRRTAGGALSRNALAPGARRGAGPDPSEVGHESPAGVVEGGRSHGGLLRPGD